ncbi:unnamed protein product [Didymodactylos carnosus]|uniref:Uncharacterized protein n=1 Tax=Didymodactylos carnosus TaxID=1234261 RepID=A0A813ZA34_9BILA|nr:unnamed protein product [Didymodactylos carnosus]CAF0895727.1 unnamed protein product [Didymodactylos carnosus]CAF3632714.1 unnamed protein product [Didymodactylos carnosus]CAF3679115.1 unnamed protein product [Didymodactylos carnosus]
MSSFLNYAELCRRAAFIKEKNVEFCAKCADHHSTEKCTTTLLKCVGCEGGHASNSNAYPSFIEQRQKLQKMIDEYTTPLKPQASLNPQNYPPLPTPSSPCPCSHH